MDITYGELDERARALAVALLEVCSPGANVLLVHPPGLGFLEGFFACVYAGVTAIPAYPPAARQARARLRAILDDARPAVALASSRPDEQLAPVTLVTGTPGQYPTTSWRPPIATPSTPALIQYTSGSTTTPKGVIVTHGNLMHNQGVIARTFEHDDESVIVSWLPVYHDMGLSNILQALYAGVPCVLMSPAHFLQRPARWLEAISRYRGTTSGGPNFAYEFCLRRIPAEQKQHLDLRSWRVAYNGAEPVRAGTLTRFAEAFAPQGFRAGAFRPCYGLAEATLMVTCAGVEGVVTKSDGERQGRELVGCGAARGCRLAIVGPSGAELPPGQVGEIWVSGPSVAAGYWNRPEETRATFEARLAGEPDRRFLRTGDLGLVSDGELFVASRLKDLIIVRGQNHYPQDIELAVEQSDDAISPGGAAAFGLEIDAEERVAIVQEAPREPVDLDALVQAIRRKVLDDHALQLAAVVLIEPTTLPRTTSGKVMRAACRARFLAGQLAVVRAWRESAASDERGRTEAPLTMASVRTFLITATAARLSVDPRTIDPDQPTGYLRIDSLAAIDLAHLVEARFGVVVPVGSFFGDAALSSIAARVLLEADASPRGGPARPIIPVAEGALSHGQRARWLLEQVVAPELGVNVVARAARVVGELDTGALRRSVARLVDRHPALRTTFSSSAGAPRQVVHVHLPPEFVEHEGFDLDDVSLAEGLDREAWRPFDLSRGPLVRVHLFRGRAGGHVLLFAAHHIVVDLWSMEILLAEWAALYAEESGAVAAPPSLAASAAERVRSSPMLRADAERLHEYWASQLDGELPRVSLLHDRRPPSPRNHRGASVHFALDELLTSRIDALAQTQHVTPYMVLLAALNLLLHRYTGQDDIVVGTPAAVRGPEELSGVVGCFINPVAIRTSVSGDPPFRDFLARVREAVSGALEHRAYPFDVLVEQLRPERNSGQPPLFDVLLVWIEAHGSRGAGVVPFALGEAGARLEFGGLALEAVEWRSQPTLFDVELMAGKVGPELHGALTYDTDIFEAATGARLVEHLRDLLEAIVDDPRQRLSRLTLGSEAQRRVLAASGEPGADAPRERLHEVFEAWAARDPAAIAITFQGEKITYAQLDARSNQLAHRLRGAGASDRPLALALDDGPRQVIGMLAILKAGCCFVCVDPDQPARIDRILGDVAPSHIIASSPLPASIQAAVQASGCEVIDFDEVEQTGGSTAPANSPASTGAAAYIVYTSGSGGSPKGIVQSHASFLQFLRWQIERFEMGPSQRIAQWATITYDAAYCEIFGALCSGATLCLASAATRHDPAALLSWVEREAITLLQVVPSFCRQLLERVATSSSDRDDPLRSVAWMLLAGEVFPVELARALLARYPTRPAIFNLYGPSESVLATCYRVANVRDDARAIPIGRPIRGRQILILDKHLQLCPSGAIGEIYIRSRHLTAGYWGRPEDTAKAYTLASVANDANDANDRMYRTGDRGRWLPSGDLEFCGRVDEQVKIRGVRVELGEVESTLRCHDSVEDCAVVTRESGHGGLQLVAYIVARCPVSNAALREAAKAALPLQAVPSAFVRLDALPLTRTRKIDRGSLPPPSAADYGADADADADAEVTGSPTEAIVARVWRDVLGVAVFGRDQSFFELGGHSLSAVQVLNRLCQCTGVELPLVTLFEAPTVAALSEQIEARGQAAQPEIARLVGEVQDLTDEEVESLLSDLRRP